MDVGAVAGALAGAQAAQVQTSLAAKMLRMNADSAASIIKVLEDAQQNINRLANVADGVGNNLDITA
jgi:hypothetical protein